MNRRSRVFDWRFIVSLILGAMVGYLIWVGVTAVKDGHEKDARVDATIELLRDEQAASKLARITAATERAVLIKKQDDLLAEVADLQRRQAALLDYLRTQGVTIPPRLAVTSSTGKSSSGGDTPKAPGKAKGPKKPKGSKRP